MNTNAATVRRESGEFSESIKKPLLIPVMTFSESKARAPKRATTPSVYLPRLNALKEEYNAAKYPHVAQTRGFYAKKYKDTSANALTAAIVAYVTLTGGYATRQQSMGVKRKVKGREIWTPGTTKRGAADINAMFQGRSLQVEVKYGKDRLSDKQKTTAAQITRAGGVYIVAKSFDHFIEQFQKAFALADNELFMLRCPIEEEEATLSF